MTQRHYAHGRAWAERCAEAQRIERDAQYESALATREYRRRKDAYYAEVVRTLIAQPAVVERDPCSECVELLVRLDPQAWTHTAAEDTLDEMLERMDRRVPPAVRVERRMRRPLTRF